MEYFWAGAHFAYISLATLISKGDKKCLLAGKMPPNIIKSHL